MRRIRKFLHHYIIPHERNNYRAKLLHHTSILFVIGLLFFGSLLISSLKQQFPSVLGVSTDITSQQLLDLTNKTRAENGLQPLVINSQLQSAAGAKATDMLSKDYWAHNSPDGTSPWVFIKGSGYQYVYAGENLARGFTSAHDAINAWMESPDHRANMLSKNYSDVGFAVVTGKLTGEDTVLIVEELGSTSLIASQQTSPQQPIPQTFDIAKSQQGVQSAAAVPQKSLINSATLSGNIITIILGIFIFVLIIDMIVIEKRKIVRFVGHNPDHIFYLVTILLLIIIILGKGIIL